MLRAVLLGVLSLSAVSCKSSHETAKSQAGIAAGMVIEVSGAVTVRHGDAARPLAKGETVEGEDTIETGADGHVIIELVHNNATWELNANKKSKVRESLAWNEPKRDRTAKAVEQDTAAAGRPAERNAAETTASTIDTVAAVPPAAPPAAAPPMQPATPKVERAHQEVAPPPPPPPAPPAKTATRAIAPHAPAAPDPSAPRGAKGGAADDDFGAGGLGLSGIGEGGGGTGGGAGLGSIGTVGHGGGAGSMHGPGDSLLRAKTADIAACWGDQKFELQLIVVVDAKGKASTMLSTKSKLTPQIEACVKKIVSSIEFPAAAARLSLKVQK